MNDADYLFINQGQSIKQIKKSDIPKPIYTAEEVGALPNTTIIPTALPNPNALTFTGAATGSYNGSSPVEINIPEGGGTGVTVDTTLSVAGQAADAKATGDAISSLSEEKVENPLTGVVGQILEIETVDESGKPKTYKAVNKPSGGGEVTDEQISNAVDNYMTAHPFTETDPTVPDWAKHPEKPRYTAEEVGADASGTAESKVSEHNVSDTAHNDLRLLVHGLTERLNALADSDDTTLDQMSEVVAYIKSNKSLIDAITTSKVSVSDIIDNLTTNASNKSLSAAQGVALKALIDDITTSKVNVSDIINNLTTNLSNKVLSASMGVELKKLIDAIKVPVNLSELAGDTTHRTVTDAEKTAWNNKSTFSGNYNDLTNKPSLFSGNYNDLSEKPTLITEERVNELINVKLPKSAEEVQY